MDNLMEVVGTMFFFFVLLLIGEPRSKKTCQMIGGKVEIGENEKEAAIRECHEELGEQAIFDEDLLEFVMDFEEIATSDPSKRIHMNIFQYNGRLEGELTTSDEIEKFMWFGVNDDINILSNTLKNEIVPYCIKNGLIREKDIER